MKEPIITLPDLFDEDGEEPDPTITFVATVADVTVCEHCGETIEENTVRLCTVPMASEPTYSLHLEHVVDMLTHAAWAYADEEERHS